MPEYDATIHYRPIPSLPETFYRAGNDGSIWGCQKPGKGHGRAGRWKRLKEHRAGRGYRSVHLGVNGVRRFHYIHRLVLEAFVGPCPEGMECCHDNGVRHDNRSDNLRWGTPVENQADRSRHGTRMEGSKVPWSKLTEADIPVIRSRLSRGEKVAAVARDYGVGPEAIRGVQSGRTWRHV